MTILNPIVWKSNRCYSNRCFFTTTVRYLLAIIGLLISSQTGFAQQAPDIVISKRKNSTETVKRKGEITQWRGASITLNVNGRERVLDNDEIVEIKTSWHPSYLAGLEALNAGDLDTALGKFQTAISLESRPWAQRIIRADFIRACTASENHLAAIQQFLAIIKEDPYTRFFHLCPLQWVPANHGLTAQAQTLMGSQEPASQLIGASWLLTGADREKAERVLNELSRDIDPNIKYLAIGQLWRTRSLTINQRQIEVWKKLMTRMPKQLKPGPWLVLAEAQARLGEKDEATINLMRIPILYPEQISLSATALYRAGTLLGNSGKRTEAKLVWSELKQKYPASIWARQAPKLE